MERGKPTACRGYIGLAGELVAKLFRRVTEGGNRKVVNARGERFCLRAYLRGQMKKEVSYTQSYARDFAV